MGRADLLNLLDVRRKTIRLADERVTFLSALARPVGFSGPEYTPIDGDALALVRAANAADLGRALTQAVPR